MLTKVLKEAMMEHRHYALHSTVPNDRGEYTNVCECGATQRRPHDGDKWHTCHLCTSKDVLYATNN